MRARQSSCLDSKNIFWARRVHRFVKLPVFASLVFHDVSRTHGVSGACRKRLMMLLRTGGAALQGVCNIVAWALRRNLVGTSTNCAGLRAQGFADIYCTWRHCRWNSDMCVCVRVRACVRACVRAGVRVCAASLLQQKMVRDSNCIRNGLPRLLRL